MGIPMLTSFMRQHFTGWREKELKGKLVIDGDALCHQLYAEFDWRSGGQYPEYRDHAIEYFRALKSSQIEPIVVFDGIDYTLKKADTIESRYEDCLKELICQFSLPSAELETCTSGSQNRKVILPRFIKKVLSMVLSELSISYVVVDGEADDDMVRLANFHSCPILSNDSDFYIYALKGGFIHMNEFDWHSKPITSKVYHMEDMLEQFKLSDGSLRFIIPAIFGNDFLTAIEPAVPRYFRDHMKRVTLLQKNHPTLYVVTYVSHYDNLRDFVNRIPSIDHYYLHSSKKKVLHDNSLKSEQMYNIQEEKSLENLISESELRILEEDDIPDWLLNQYRRLDTGTRLMYMMVVGKLRLTIMVEDPSKPSSHYFSRSLRQAAYSIVGLKDVVESIRVVDDVHESVIVPFCDITYDGQTVLLDIIPNMELESKKKIIYFFLHSNINLLELLEEKWRLVTASIIYWSETAKVSLSTLKVLLLTSVVCSSSNACNMIVRLSEDVKMSPAFEYGPQWLEGLHAFAQWQCCYMDASTLNSVLQMPLQFYSPAFLYSGELALKFYFLSLSADCGTDSVLGKIPEESKVLYHQLLSTILSHKSVCCSKEDFVLTKETIIQCRALVYDIH